MGFDVSGKTALVTGANRGIGKSITESLIAAQVEKVYAAVRDVSTLGDLRDAYGDQIIPVRCDLTDRQTVQQAGEIAGDVELVINNAAVLTNCSALSSAAVDSIQFELQTNVIGLLHIVQAFAPRLAANGGGAFVQVNSMASIKSFPGFATYCASKAAAYSLTQSLRVQLADQGTVVVSVHPGPIATDMGDHAGLSDVAEPADVVGPAIVRSLKHGEFHCFPDTMAKKLQRHYQPFASRVIERD